MTMLSALSAWKSRKALYKCNELLLFLILEIAIIFHNITVFSVFLIR